MIVTAARILELNGEHKLVENLSERERTNPEGVGIDVRAGRVFRLTGPAFLGIEERETPGIETLADIGRGDCEYTLAPGAYVLVQTIEGVNLPAGKIVIDPARPPAHLCAMIWPRSTLHRSGVALVRGKIDPGYHGTLTLALHNAGPHPFRIELGARFANLVFHETVGDLARAYEGQWRGGRVAATKRETQN